MYIYHSFITEPSISHFTMKPRLPLKPLSPINCIPLALIILFLLFPGSFMYMSHSILGKLLAVFLIMYYSAHHFIYGFALCIFVIWYYQSTKPFHERFSGLSDSTQSYADFLPKPASSTTSSIKKEPSSTAVTELPSSSHTSTISCGVSHAYPSNLPKVHPESEEVFRKKHCSVNKVMVYKNLEIRKPDITHHLSEIEFHGNDTTCNPCDPTCHFSIRTLKRDTEETLKPLKTRDFPDFVPNQVRALFS